MPSARSLFVVFLTAGILIGVGIGTAVFYHPNQTPIVLPASKPRNLGAVSGIGNVTLNWTAPSDDGGSPITGYKVYRTFSSSSLLITLSADALSFVDYTGIPGTIYVYNVQAMNSAGGGFPSDPTAAASRENTSITPTGFFLWPPSQVTVGYKLIFGVFTQSTTNFTDCKVVVTVDGVASEAQTISLTGNTFTAPSDIAISWADLASNNAINVGDYLTITGGNLTAPTALPAGSYVVTIIFTSTGGTICSQMWVSPSEQTPIGSFTGTPEAVTNGYKLTFGLVTPSTNFTDCAVMVTIANLNGVSSTTQVINLSGNTVDFCSLEWTDLASDGVIGEGDYVALTQTNGLAEGLYAITIFFASTWGTICTQSWFATTQTPTGAFTGTPAIVTNGYKFTFGAFSQDVKFVDCKVVITIGGVASTAQTIVLAGQNFVGLNMCIRWTDLAADGKISTGDYLTITGGTVEVPVALPSGSYTISILFTSTGGVICSQSLTF